MNKFPCLLSALLPVLLLFAPHDDVASARKFVSMLSQRHFIDASKQFNEKMATALPPKTLQETWDHVIAQTGDFIRIINTHNDRKQGYLIVFVTCAFVKTDLDFKITFDNEGYIAGLFFVPSSQNTSTLWSAPPYARRAAFLEESVRIGNRPWQLPGILTIPIGRGPFPAVLLVHGSGPHDMDETFGRNKPFKDIAWGLASQGVAVLRYSKRTFVYGAEFRTAKPLFTVQEETVDDARAAADMLVGTRKIDPRAVFLAGHSLGGMLAPRIALDNSDISGLIILAGPSRPLEQYFVKQTKYLAKLMPHNAEAQRQAAEAEKAARQIDNVHLNPASIIDVMGAEMPGSYWIDLRNYDAIKCAASLRIPILVLQGGRDYQVGQADLEAWKAALAERPNTSFRFYPRLNHFFMAGSKVLTPAEYDQPAHVAQIVIGDIAAWVKQMASASIN